MSSAHVLLVAGDANSAHSLQQRLTRLGYEVVAPPTSEPEARLVVASNPLELVLLETHSGDSTGLERARHWSSLLDLPLVWLTEHGAAPGAREPPDVAPIILPRSVDDALLVTLLDLTRRTRSAERRARMLEDQPTSPVQGATNSVGLEQALRACEQALRGSNTSVWEFTLVDGSLEKASFLSVNYFASLGHTTGDPRSREQVRALLHPDDRTLLFGSMRAAVEAGARFEVEVRLWHADGTYHWNIARGVVLRDEQRLPVRFVGCNLDIHEKRLAEEALRKARDVAEAANRAKGDFLANVSHEIRTPMNAILGMTELVLDSPLSQGQRQSLRTVMSAASSLLGTINDLLDFSKIEAGKLGLDPAPFALRTALNETLRALAVRAHRKGLELMCDVRDDVPDSLYGDEGRLRQVLMNLVGNAIKFTEKGEVVVKVGLVRADTAAQAVELRFSVSDTGVGVAADKQQAVFRAFEQEDTSTTRKYGGTGLGLTIAARLVALMGGEITLVSEHGRGSVFSFTARFGLLARPVATTTVRPAVVLKGVRVLIVDDNRVNRDILEAWCRGWQMDATAAGDGMSAMDALWHAVASGNPYQLILLDARMPDTDGLTLAAKIRERSELAATKVILLTSGDRPGDLDRFRELRLNAHLLKSVAQEELLETIHAVIDANAGDVPVASRGAQESSASLAEGERLNVLVAEDNELNSRLLQQLLLKKGHHVEVAADGRTALELLHQGRFDLLLLDLHMPGLDGFEVVRAIRERERETGEHLPVVALTARSQAEDRERCLRAGMDEFVTKPIAAAQLWSTVDRLARPKPSRVPH